MTRFSRYESPRILSNIRVSSLISKCLQTLDLSDLAKFLAGEASEVLRVVMVAIVGCT